jgi:hypothetical protein
MNPELRLRNNFFSSHNYKNETESYKNSENSDNPMESETIKNEDRYTRSTFGIPKFKKPNPPKKKEQKIANPDLDFFDE